MNRGAAAELIRGHQAEIYRYVRYLGAAQDVAEDLVQETFLAALRGAGPPAGKPPRVVAAWLRGVARNLFLTHCRRQKRNPVRISSQLVREAEDYWSSTLLRDGDGFDYVEALRRCVSGLNGRKRLALKLRYAQGKSRAEMAAVLDMTENGVRSLLQRVRAALGGCIAKRLATEEL